MKTTTVLGILLIGSLTLNYFLYRETQKDDDIVPVDMTCSATNGFETQVSISNDEARGFISEYKSTLTDPDSILGGIITRSALDSIMCTPDCNAISYSFARDSIGKTGPSGNGVFVIFSGLNVTYDEQSQTIREYKDLGINVGVHHLAIHIKLLIFREKKRQ
jgi:hypothetical protein